MIILTWIKRLIGLSSSSTGVVAQKLETVHRPRVGENVQMVMPDRFGEPKEVHEEFSKHPRKALILTTVVCETQAVQAHLVDARWLVGAKGNNYEYGRFADSAGDWLVVHALTAQGNSAAALTVSRAHQEFGKFDVFMFVGVAGSLKPDIPIGSVVVGDHVHNGHAGKVEDDAVLSRPIGHTAHRLLLTASQALIACEAWKNLIKSPKGIDLPSERTYADRPPPLALIKGIVSGEEVVAGGKSQRYRQLRQTFNNCGAVEMEGWGAMCAAHEDDTPAIIIRGISDMCAGKDYAADALDQPIAAAHAAAFAFSILAFRSRVPRPRPNLLADVKPPPSLTPEGAAKAMELRSEYVLNFEGNPEDWDDAKVAAVMERVRGVLGDEQLTFVRVERGSVRLVVNARADDFERVGLEALRIAASELGVSLLGAASISSVVEADAAIVALAQGSQDLLSWEQTLPAGAWMPRPEEEAIGIRFELDFSTTVLLGEPGSGKSALLSKIGAELLEKRLPVLAIKADFLNADISTEADLQVALQLPQLPSSMLLNVAVTRPAFLLIDQLDALASQLDLKSGRLNVLLNLVRRVSSVPNVHVLLSARTFEFNHDVRLRSTEAEAMSLSLPPWQQVREQLASVGINADSWPERSRDVVRIPQALKTFISLVQHGLTEPFTTYQAMLARFWSERISSADDGSALVSLAEDMAGKMAEEEVLWLAASRFDDRLLWLNRLEALGLVVSSTNGLSIAFSHQTLFEFVLARTFVRDHGLLANYVLERQDSLFVRSKVWAALNYLRGAEEGAYQRELLQVWNVQTLRRHLRLLLIEFLGQVRSPIEFERELMASSLNEPDTRTAALKSLSQNADWFPHFAQKQIREAMNGSDDEAFVMARLLGISWPIHAELVLKVVRETWLCDPTRDEFTWTAIADCAKWNDDLMAIAELVLERTDISTWAVGSLAMALAVEQTDFALRAVRSRLNFLLQKTQVEPAPPPFPSDGSEEKQTARYRRSDPRKSFDTLLDSQEWTELPSLAEAAPISFIRICWPWYVKVFAEIVRSDSDASGYTYPSRYVVELDFNQEEENRYPRERPLIEAARMAIENFALTDPGEYMRWVEEYSPVEQMPVQQLIARGFQIAGKPLATDALRWLLADQRRFQLGNVRGHRTSTLSLIRNIASHLSKSDVHTFEAAVHAYRPPIPAHLTEPSQRKIFADLVRASKKDLLQAIGPDRLSPANQELVVTEQRALGDRFDRSFSMGEVGVIGSPMDSANMAKAKDRDILKIFSEVPDKTNWDHPIHWMRGGNIQLSRAFADFAKSEPKRATRLIEQFEPGKQERAAAYALEALAQKAEHDDLVIGAFIDLHTRGFGEGEFKDSAARAIDKIANRDRDVGEQVIRILESWLDTTNAEGDDNADSAAVDGKDEETRSESLLWGHGSATALPSGNFSILSALASVLLDMGESGRDRYMSILRAHLIRERDPKLWKALLYRLGNAGGASPAPVSVLIREIFKRVPEIASTREAVLFLAHAQRWDDALVYELIREWGDSSRNFLQQAHGELVGLVGIVKPSNATWHERMWELVHTGSEAARIGVAYAAVNLISDKQFRECASDVLVALLSSGGKYLVAVVVDIFRLLDDFERDASLLRVLQALAEPKIDLSSAPSHFIVEKLQQMLPHEAKLVGEIGGKLVAAWRPQLSDMRTATAAAAPQLTDLALTLHRLGGATREAGVTLFEAMIETDAHGARDTLTEIDGRFSAHNALPRARLARRRSRRAG